MSSPHTVCTLAVRFLGLVLVVLSLPTVGRVCHDILQDFCLGTGWEHLSPFIIYEDPNERLGYIGTFAQLGLGLYMFLSGRWVISKLTRGLGGGCPRCGYDTAGNVSGLCPECGTKLPVPRTTRTD